MFEKIQSSINDGMIAIYGLIALFFFKIIGFISKKIIYFLDWLAKSWAKAAGKEIEEMLKKIITEWFKPYFDELRKEFDLKIDELREDVSNYKKKKHSVKGELDQLKAAIDDPEISREELKSFIKKDD